MKFRPLGDRVVVRRIKEDQKTAGGIIIPDTVAEKPQEGEVISIGPGAIDEKTGKRTPLEVKAGSQCVACLFLGCLRQRLRNLPSEGDIIARHQIFRPPIRRGRPQDPPLLHGPRNSGPTRIVGLVPHEEVPVRQNKQPNDRPDEIIHG